MRRQVFADVTRGTYVTRRERCEVAKLLRGMLHLEEGFVTPAMGLGHPPLVITSACSS